MKISVPLRNHNVRILSAIIACLLLSVTVPSYASLCALAPLREYASDVQVPQSSGLHYLDSIFVEKQFTRKKYKIRLYPNANQEVLFFSASGDEGKIYQLFLFDMDGGLVKQAHIKNKQTTVINNLDNGVYLFQVFSDDEPISNGKVTVR